MTDAKDQTMSINVSSVQLECITQMLLDGSAESAVPDQLDSLADNLAYYIRLQMPELTDEEFMKIVCRETTSLAAQLGVSQEVILYTISRWKEGIGLPTGWIRHD